MLPSSGYLQPTLSRVWKRGRSAQASLSRVVAWAMEFRKRGVVPLCVTFVVMAAVFLTATRIRSEDDASFTDLSSLYSCSNGNPGVSKAYQNGNFEINDVELQRGTTGFFFWSNRAWKSPKVDPVVLGRSTGTS